MTTRNPQPPVTTDEAVFGRVQWRQQLARDYASTERRLTQAYGTLLRTLQPYVDDLTRAVIALIDQGITPDRYTVAGLDSYQRLFVRVRVEMQSFSTIAQAQASNLQTSATASGIRAAGQLVRISSGWLTPNAEAVTALVNYVDSPAMRANFAQFGQNAARDMADLILSQFAQGRNPRAVARSISDWLGNVPLSWANNMTRTVQIWSYRMGNHATYRANERVLEGWIWSSARDTRTCISCWSQHGRVYRLDQVLRDHHQGRCAPIPLVRGSTRQWQTGEQLFDNLRPEQQQQIMGPGLYDAWRRGDVQFNELSVPYYDDVYGEMLRRPTNRELGIR